MNEASWSGMPKMKGKGADATAACDGDSSGALMWLHLSGKRSEVIA